MLKLFQDLMTGQLFHFGDSPWRVHIKGNDTHYVSPEGLVKPSHPHVAIVPERGSTKDYRSFYGENSTTGDNK